jgi:hypothetical protein
MGLLGKKCFACRDSIGKGDIPKYHRMASGNRECFCKRCSNTMGGHGMTNQIKDKQDKKNKEKAKGPNTGKYFG